jgi:hypothetical protein
MSIAGLSVAAVCPFLSGKPAIRRAMASLAFTADTTSKCFSRPQRDAT